MNAQLNRLQERVNDWAGRTLSPRDHIIEAESILEEVVQYLQVLEERVTRMEVAGWESKVKAEPVCPTCGGIGQINVRPEAMSDDYDKGTEPCPTCTKL